MAPLSSLLSNNRSSTLISSTASKRRLYGAGARAPFVSSFTYPRQRQGVLRACHAEVGPHAGRAATADRSGQAEPEGLHRIVQQPVPRRSLVHEHGACAGHHRWRGGREYNEERPKKGLGGLTPATKRNGGSSGTGEDPPRTLNRSASQKRGEAVAVELRSALCLRALTGRPLHILL